MLQHSRFPGHAAQFPLTPRSNDCQLRSQSLYGQKLQGSVTRLEQFAACAYAHFLKYGLELMERQEYQFRGSGYGNLFHQSIDLCFQAIQSRKLDWKGITELRERLW